MRLLNLFLDRLEEWLIGALIAAATVLTFVALLHRYGASNFAELARWGGAHGLTHVHVAADQAYVWLAAIDLSWAQELATYMFVWMASSCAQERRSEEHTSALQSSWH